MMGAPLFHVSRAKRPERACTECGHRTTARGGRCAACRRLDYNEGSSPAHALPPGRWVKMGHIQVYVAD